MLVLIRRFHFRLLERNCVFQEVKLNEGIAHLMAENKSDVGIRPYVYTQLKAGRFVELTKPVSLYSFGIAQYLTKPTGIQSDLSSFLHENRMLIFCVLIGYLVPLLSICTISIWRLQMHRRSIRSIRTTAPKLLFLPNSQKRVIYPKLALIFVFFTLFLFIMRHILTNLIKTNAVILDTSQFIDSRERLFESPKTMMICGNPLEKDLQSGKPMGKSFTFKLFSQKSKQGRLLEVCQSKKNIVRMNEQAREPGLSSMYFLMDRVYLIWFLWLFMTANAPLFIYIGTEIYFEESIALTVRRNLPPGIKQKVSGRYVGSSSLCHLITN